MPCSAVTLSLATVAGIVSVTLLAIAFGTDNWMYIRVDRDKITPELENQSHNQFEPSYPKIFNSERIYFSRTQGLFRVCYPKGKPTGVELYLSPVETYCENIDYYIIDDKHLTKSFSEERMARLHMARSMIALFVVSFLFIFVAFWTGIVGCWKRSPSSIGTTAVIMLFACLFAAGGMGLWHGVQYYEEKKLNEEPFYRSWPPLLQKYTYADYDWSYYIAWVGIGWMVVSSLLFVGASVCLKREVYSERHKHVPYYMPVYQTKTPAGTYAAPYANCYNYPPPGAAPQYYTAAPQYASYNY